VQNTLTTILAIFVYAAPSLYYFRQRRPLVPIFICITVVPVLLGLAVEGVWPEGLAGDAGIYTTCAAAFATWASSCVIAIRRLLAGNDEAPAVAGASGSFHLRPDQRPRLEMKL
jgi:hypothetical protein